MTREKLTQHIRRTYHVQGDQPFSEDFDSTVFRHEDNQKWFALVMRIGRDKLGMEETEQVDALTVKIEPEMAALLVGSGGVYPAYHMNKKHWVTLLLDGTTPDETIKSLLDMSYGLTESRKRSKTQKKDIKNKI